MINKTGALVKVFMDKESGELATSYGFFANIIFFIAGTVQRQGQKTPITSNGKPIEPRFSAIFDFCRDMGIPKEKVQAKIDYSYEHHAEYMKQKRERLQDKLDSKYEQKPNLLVITEEEMQEAQEYLKECMTNGVNEMEEQYEKKKCEEAV